MPEVPAMTMDQSVFEGMYVRALKPEGEFLEGLRALGYDPSWPKPSYPAELFQKTAKLACKYVFPGLPEQQALEKLGAMFIEGFFKTIIGRVGRVTLPFLSAKMLMSRFPENTQRVGSVRCEVAPESEGVWRMTYFGAHVNPHFTLGVTRKLVEQLGTVELATIHSDTFELLFREKAKR